MSLSEQFNVGARIHSRTAMAVAVTQTSNTAATTQDGLTIDRNESGLRRYYSCKVCVGAQFLYAASSVHIATVASINFQHSSDGTSWESFSTATCPATAVTWGSSSGGAVGTTAGTAVGTLHQSVNLNGARRYVRMQLPAPTFTDSSSGSVLSVGAVIVFGGADELPAQ